jgi:hypothetical protein
MRNLRRSTSDRAQFSGRFSLAVSDSLAARDRAISGAFERDRRTHEPGKEGRKMRQVKHWHRSLVILGVGLLALAAPLVALAGDGGPIGH